MGAAETPEIFENGRADLRGTWNVSIGEARYGVTVPGTLDESGIGEPDKPELAARLTRKHVYEGPALFTRTWKAAPASGERLFLEVERARCLSLRVNGKDVPAFVPGTLSTPHIFEITGFAERENTIQLLSDNSYPGLPREAILYSSAATDETQTNWNGLLGYVRVRAEKAVFVSAFHVYPRGGAADISVEVSAAQAYQGVLTVASRAFERGASADIILAPGMTTVLISGVPLRADALRWDEEEGNLYEATAEISGFGRKTIRFGVREFCAGDDGRLKLNGRTVFLRGETNCCIFPETGHMPMTVPEWEKILAAYKSYGVNCLRFHSHCPPEAAFTAADRLGVLMQPELSHWDPRAAFEDDISFRYYREELRLILHAYANHPSFVMLTLGNELWTGEPGQQRMCELLAMARETDPTRLYANGSNVGYGQAGADAHSDFYTSQKYFDEDLRGTFANMEGPINNRYPSAQAQYGKAMERIREAFQKPVFSFEVGQYEVLPDFGEIETFRGVTLPVNLEVIRRRAGEQGLLPRWKAYAEASGELALLCYREEVEAALRTDGLSGISLLSLQDFPGQGTALVGMLNSHLQPKPYAFASPERFRAFFAPALPLVFLPKYTYTAGEVLPAQVKVANYGKEELGGAARWMLSGAGFAASGELPAAVCPRGMLTLLGRIEVPLSGIRRAVRLDLEIRISGIQNAYPVWVYPEESAEPPEGVHVASSLDDDAVRTLLDGGKVFLTPEAEKASFPHAVRSQFSPDFWSVGTFPKQGGAMGCLIHREHPLFEGFPTEMHTNWQWWPMVNGIAIPVPDRVRPIVTVLDSFAYLRHMSLLFECRVGKGRLMVSGMGLMEKKRYPEVRALLSAIFRYMASDMFKPAAELTPQETASICKA